MNADEAKAKADGRSFQRPDGTWINYGLPSRDQLRAIRSRSESNKVKPEEGCGHKLA